MCPDDCPGGSPPPSAPTPPVSAGFTSTPLKSDRHDLSQLRSIQDWFLRYELTSVPGVSEVASIGGYVKQYQVVVDPNKLRAYNIPIQKVRMAIQRSNNDVGGRLVEMGETEFMVRGLGYIKSIDDLKVVPLGVNDRGTPILLRNVATVQTRSGAAPRHRRLQRRGGSGGRRRRHALRGKRPPGDRKRQEETRRRSSPACPKGWRSEPSTTGPASSCAPLHTLKGKLIEESIIVALVCIVFLLHFRSALVAIFTLPVGVLIAFIVMHHQGINANIMTLGGIAIAIGAMVDACHRHDRERPQAHRARRREKATLGADHRRLQGGGAGPLLLPA